MPSLLRVLRFFFLLVNPVSASTFNPNCTIPPHNVNYVSSPEVRGTFNILWSSVFTLVLCTWTVQHLNVPEQRPEGGQTFWEASKWRLKGGAARLKWMLATLLMPELLVGVAFQDMMIAMRSRRIMGDFASADGVEWTMTHAFYANMGGFVLKVKFPPARSIDHNQGSQAHGPATSMSHNGTNPVERPREVNGEGQKKQERPSLSEKDTMEVKEEEARISGAQKQPESPSKTAHQVVVSVDNLAPTELENSPQIQTPTEERAIYLTARDLYKLREVNIIEKLPTISLNDIEDKSKGDFIVKGTTLIQVLSLLIQVIVRAIKRLPISQLEIAVLAFSMCASVTYLFYWWKPQNITTPTYFTTDGNHPKLFDKSTFPPRSSWFQSTFEFWDPKSTLDLISCPIPNDIEYQENFEFIRRISDQSWTFIDDGVIVTGTIFGALHCLAWNFQFPSRTEGLLWRIAGVGSAATPLAYTLVFNVHYSLKGTYRLRPLVGILFVLTIVLPLFYVLARLYLMVEAFRSLLYLPPEAFITTWSAQIPQFG